MNANYRNPFDDDDGTFRVLANSAGDLSLWPEFAQVPAGWSVVFGPTDRAACIVHLERSESDVPHRRLAASSH